MFGIFALYSLTNHKTMAEIKMRPAVYANHKRKDGSYPVKIVVYFKGKERKLATHIVAEAKDLTRSLHLKQGDALSAAQDMIIKMRAACKDIPYFDLEYRDVDYVVSFIKGKLASEDFRLDFFQFYKDHIKSKKESTRAQYMQALNAFQRFFKKDEVDVNAITRSMVQEFIAFLDAEPKIVVNGKTDKPIKTGKKKTKGGQAARHVYKLSAIYKEAKKKYNDEDAGRILIPRSPFENHDLPIPAPQGQKPLPEEIIQKMIKTETDCKTIRDSLDIAIVSFGLMGMNLADLYEAQEPKDGVLVYYRKKTRDKRADKAEMRINVPECLTPYIERLKGNIKGAWLGRLREKTDNPNYITGYVNKGFAKWCKEQEFERFTFYAFRKSWGTIARRIGVEKAIVDEGLVHVGDYQMTDIYAERPWEQINEANKRVLELFKWD